ncbi:MAG: hypothetical protein WAL50_11395 [Kineosporiaceae bacterium]
MLAAIWRSLFPGRREGDARDEDGRAEARRQLAAEQRRTSRSDADVIRERNNWPIL